MQVQKLLAGMRDRGATCAVVECSDAGLQAGHLRFVDLAVAVHTNFSGAGADHELFEGDKEKVLEAQLELFETLLDETAQVGVRGENAGPLAITLRGGGGVHCRQQTELLGMTSTGECMQLIAIQSAPLHS